jgi:hemerythrin
MSIIKWDESLNLGVERIDSQHKQLINTINELHLAVQYGTAGSTIVPLIARLKDYAKAHFLSEELLFADLGYQGLAEHKQEHVTFLAQIEGLAAQFSYNKDFMAVHIKDMLLTWFYHHIRTRDMEYKELVGSPKVPHGETIGTAGLLGNKTRV